MSVILWGDSHVTMAVEVLCDWCVTFSTVRFSGGPSSENIEKRCHNYKPGGTTI